MPAGGRSVGRSVLAALLPALIVTGVCRPARGAEGDLLRDGGFERADPASQELRPFEQGFAVDASVRRSGNSAIRCSSHGSDERRGATFVVDVAQKTAAPIVVEGWSRAENVGGFANNDYSIYVDLTCADGTPLWGQTAPFSVGTHEWEHRRVLIWPQKPVKQLYIHALFRHHTGTVWFDDFSARQLGADDTFDGQVMRAPAMPAGRREGWFIRDLSSGGPLRPLASGVSRKRTTVSGGLAATLAAEGDRRRIRLEDTTGRARAVTIYYVRVVPPGNYRWWNDIRTSTPCAPSGEYANLTRLGVGATGMQSLYPFACITSTKTAVVVGTPPDLGPSVFRLGYHSSSRLMYAAFDVVLSPTTLRCSRDGRGLADVAVVTFSVDPTWAFRAAAQGYYSRFPAWFDRRAKAEGLWVPFADPARVDRPEDYGFAYHEGDNSVASDDRLGILSFRYTEPQTWWMPMEPSAPRTYETAMAMVQNHLTSPDASHRHHAQAVLNSGSRSASGLTNVEFQNAPWTNGAVWVLNPNPALPHGADHFTKARLSYTRETGDHLYGAGRPGVLDGEYLDSIEGWGDVLDYGEDAIRYSSVPPTFECHSLRPVIPTYFSVWELARSMRDDLRARGKLLMANATPWRLHLFAPLLDVMGTETNWKPGGTWRPDSDAVFCLRRTLCFRKPYLLLQNTDFDRFSTQDVEKYMQRSMFYGVYPSMFSVDASSRNYWTEPGWYNRDRSLFRKYIPVIKRLSRAGWEPITWARSSSPSVLVERFGNSYFTVLNDSGAPLDASVVVPLRVAGHSGPVRVVDVVSGAPMQAALSKREAVVRLRLKPEECIVLEVTSAHTPTR